MPMWYKGYETICGTDAVKYFEISYFSCRISESRPVSLCECRPTIQDLVTRVINNQFLTPRKVILIIGAGDLAMESDPLTWV